MYHPDTEEAADLIDATIFTGDGGGEDGRAKLKEYCERWLRGLAEWDGLDIPGYEDEEFEDHEEDEFDDEETEHEKLVKRMQAKARNF